MVDRVSLQSGMPVCAPGGARLGSVGRLNAEGFILKIWSPSRPRRWVPLEELAEVRHGRIYLAHGWESAQPLESAHPKGPLTAVLPLGVEPTQVFASHV